MGFQYLKENQAAQPKLNMPSFHHGTQVDCAA